MDKSEFRIIEFDGEFTIQRKFIEKTGFFFHKKREVWCNITKKGNNLISTPFYSNLRFKMPVFKDLDQAKQTVLKLIEGEIIHEI